MSELKSKSSTERRHRMTEEEQIKIMEHELRHFSTFFEKLAWMKFEFDHDPKFTRNARTIVLRNAMKGDPAYGQRDNDYDTA